MNNKQNKILVITLVISALLLASGCARIYKLDIEQGNKLSPELISQVKTGMTEEEVKDLLGTPALNDVFHKNRWNYVYYKKPGYGKLVKSRVIVFFKDGMVSEVRE